MGICRVSIYPLSFSFGSFRVKFRSPCLTECLSLSLSPSLPLSLVRSVPGFRGGGQDGERRRSVRQRVQARLRCTRRSHNLRRHPRGAEQSPVRPVVTVTPFCISTQTETHTCWALDFIYKSREQIVFLGLGLPCLRHAMTSSLTPSCPGD